jgi:hypothetical protein
LGRKLGTGGTCDDGCKDVVEDIGEMRVIDANDGAMSNGGGVAYGQASPDVLETDFDWVAVRMLSRDLHLPNPG